MSKREVALGIDCSTQSITGVLIDMCSSALILEHSVSYTQRLAHFELDDACLLPPWEKGAAEQPPLLFLEALDILLSDIKDHLKDIACIAVSAQQHGHVYLSKNINTAPANENLASQYAHSFSYPNAPIWMSSNTSQEARHIREYCGGSDTMMDISGSDSPLRFTGAIIRRIALSHPKQYHQTKRIHLISSFLTSVLTGKECGIDFGNAAGMSLMQYKQRKWSDLLLSAVTQGLSDTQTDKKNDAAKALRDKLPSIIAPDTPVGTIAAYFTKKYGIPSSCVVSAGSGDNPQTKTLVRGDMLSLGSSFVIMAESTKRAKYTTAMYDGLGRPFVFACRTNGALCWDQVRTAHYNSNAEKKAKEAVIQAGERVLQETPLGSSTVFYQPQQESFPPSKAFAIQGATGNLTHDYPGIVDSTLAILRAYSESFCNTKSPLFLTGGPTRSKSILARVAAFWNRPVVALPPFGAAMGAAINAIAAWNQTVAKNDNTVSIKLHQLIPQTDYITPKEDAVKQAIVYKKKVISNYNRIISL